MAIQTVTDGTAFNGNFKNRYVGKVENIIPVESEFQRRVDFESAERMGKYFVKAVQLRRPQGITFANGTTANTAFALNGSISGNIEQALIEASSIVMQDQIAYTTLARATNTQQAFENTFDLVVEGMMSQIRTNIELMCFHGQSDLGTIETATTVSLRRAVVISKATWAAGIWPQVEGAKVDVYADATLATKINGTAALQVVAIDVAARTITLDGADYASVVAGNVIVPYGTGIAGANWALGMSKIITKSGTIFGIDNTTWGNFRGNSYTGVSGVLTLGKINTAAALAWNRGTANKLTCFVSSWTWADMNVDAAALRRFAESTKSGLDIGTTSITYFAPNGQVEIVPHRFVKAGEAYLVDLSKWSRVGSMDVTFNLPVPGFADNFLQQMPSNAGFEVRNYSDQAPFCWDLSGQTLISGIVNNSL